MLVLDARPLPAVGWPFPFRPSQDVVAPADPPGAQANQRGRSRFKLSLGKARAPWALARDSDHTISICPSRQLGRLLGWLKLEAGWVMLAKALSGCNAMASDSCRMRSCCCHLLPQRIAR